MGKTTQRPTYHCFKGTQDVPQNADGFVRGGNHVVAADPTGDRVQQLHQILRQQTHHLRGQGVGQRKGGRGYTHVPMIVAAHGNAPQGIRLHLVGENISISMYFEWDKSIGWMKHRTLTMAVNTSSISRHTAAPCSNRDEYTMPLDVCCSPSSKVVESETIGTQNVRRNHIRH